MILFKRLLKVKETDFNTGNKNYEFQYKQTSELVKKGTFEILRDKSMKTISNFSEILPKKGFISKYNFLIKK